jgi:two-component system response regulator FixJ
VASYEKYAPSAARTETERLPVHVLDDDAQVRRSLWFFLTAAGYAPRVFSHGGDFLAELEHLPPAPLLLDLYMGDLNGFQVLEAMRSHDSTSLVIVLTGQGDVSGAVKAMKLGAADFIEKPFNDDELLAAILKASSAIADLSQKDREARSAKHLLECLSGREREVLACLNAGKSNKLIARDLGLSTRTVEMHRANMMQRLGVRSLPEALKIAQFLETPTGATGLQ